MDFDTHIFMTQVKRMSRGFMSPSQLLVSLRLQIRMPGTAGAFTVRRPGQSLRLLIGMWRSRLRPSSKDYLGSQMGYYMLPEWPKEHDMCWVSILLLEDEIFMS
jgi:hypothetical protein